MVIRKYRETKKRTQPGKWEMMDMFGFKYDLPKKGSYYAVTVRRDNQVLTVVP